MQEIEIKFLGINKLELENKIKALGGVFVGEYLYKRKVFDYPNMRLDAMAAWVRLRDEGEQITLSFKQRMNPDGNSGKDAGMIEHEIIVSDFNATAEILRALGLIEKFYFENKRVRYILDNIELDIDEWPLLDPYLEIEGKSYDEVYAVAQKLGFDSNDAKEFSATQIYALAGIHDKEYAKMTFDEVVKK